MFSPGFGNPRQLLVLACAVAALAIPILSWYATQSVHSECVFSLSKVTGVNGNTLPDEDGRMWSNEELVDRA
ncbi:hypothetical protein ACOZE3_33270 [Streptomyces cinereoruber]|uniref:hypothetical protein n=1 Tax=Streptomyces cinereoruber TaxID=67260 RepID=UPI003BF49FAA